MHIAIPVAGGEVSAHFGHCDAFRIFETEDGAIRAQRDVTPPGHAPGVLPAFLKEQGVDVVLAGGMGGRAKGLFAEAGIQTVTGVTGEPQAAVRAFIEDRLEPGEDTCAH
ncbi:NifB/NifX family molybdenum-iron cluster-binding protein [Kiritimatiella glycovorans]|uniref:Dinitrogenase iron-molybdenum cofactor n=1 Tax=Kiritimatiella glycovorans TaxID=1307763 RepID=A0A0G3EE88_9BACT|nr:NifB/NifX family molybdenum-iron cluster-binding protein [Kiritimatiella glycovorans]AKJ63732.1 Dinitrogenase iron-molybdenum cofactor [Kiritimatiella glycovorans]